MYKYIIKISTYLQNLLLRILYVRYCRKIFHDSVRVKSMLVSVNDKTRYHGTSPLPVTVPSVYVKTLEKIKI